MANENVVQQTGIVTIDPIQYVTETFAPFKDSLAVAISETKNVSYDIATKEGMKTAKEGRALFKSIRINAEKTRKDRKEPILQIGKLLDEHYKEIEAEAKGYEDVYDTDIKKEEERLQLIKDEILRKEAARKSEVQNNINKLKDAPVIAINMNSTQIDELIQSVQNTEISKENFDDLVTEAELEQRRALDSLKSLREGKLAIEAQAEQEAQRKEVEKAKEDELARVEGIKQKISLIENAIITGSMCETLEELNVIIEKVNTTKIDSTFAEFYQDAIDAKEKVLSALSRTQKIIEVETKEKEVAKAAEVKPVEKVPEKSPEFPKELEAEFGKHFKQDEPNMSQPSANEIVEILANARHVDKATAHKWLLTTDFAMLIAA